MFGNSPILGIESKEISDDGRPILGRTRRITGSAIFGRNPPPVVGDNGPAMSNGPSITRSPIVGSGKEISERIFGRR